jgi:hypothetical protein
MTRLAFQPHWLEQAIGEEREPARIAQKVADHPEFRKLIEEAISFSQQNCTEPSQQTRVLAEQIASKLNRSFEGFTTTD